MDVYSSTGTDSTFHCPAFYQKLKYPACRISHCSETKTIKKRGIKRRIVFIRAFTHSSLSSFFPVFIITYVKVEL
jgi:hypothetical protein